MLAHYAKLRRNGVMLVLALLCLFIAAANPSAKLTRDIHNYVFVIDISQSMNVRDMAVSGVAFSRLEYTKSLIGNTLPALPCGSKVSLALFANSEVVPLYAPIEVCANYNVLQDTLAHIEWRNAWRGGSHIRLGLQAAASLLNTLPDPAQIVFFTDGDEAPAINAITKIELKGMQGSNGWLLAGIGATKPSPIPKLDERNTVLGYWSLYAAKMDAVSAESRGGRDDSIATDPGEYYLSALRENYMKEMALDIGAAYVRADQPEKLLQAINLLPPAGRQQAPVALGWLFALLAGLCLLSEYLTKHLTKPCLAWRASESLPERAAEMR